MTDREKEIGERILKALETMPEQKKECLLYYTEGMASVTNRKQDG